MKKVQPGSRDFRLEERSSTEVWASHHYERYMIFDSKCKSLFNSRLTDKRLAVWGLRVNDEYSNNFGLMEY